MDKQELYVAASRSREETFIYATPEIQTHREEIAPESPYLRGGIPHIAEAAERDRAQLAAHDEALGSQFSGLPTEELARIDSWEARSRRETARLEVELVDMPAVGDAARRELAVADQVLAQRRELAIIAARISPPAYVKNELGERPSDPAMRKAWDRGVSQIERYRQEHGVTDLSKAFGREAKRGAERARQLGKGLSIGR